ncbi:S-methyl-5'-thioinosine phosphorylase [Teredinibacter haidensis]|uniref:S-methyl-5'-thioinosine phosphorylase n=1 Tax=Teredinibacter haidensis TaxID=2731755 RepID=UPI0009490DA5|nr:S-methyl-5'-thioinosine phosphorylase [Teredinibacter haidensis]
MAVVGIVGGSGFYSFPQIGDSEVVEVETRYSKFPVAVITGKIGGTEICFIARHGKNHNTPPHRINYRANIDALSQLSVEHIMAMNAVGGINARMSPGCVVLPDQIIDYTWGRDHTFFDTFNDELSHIDFSFPLESPLRGKLCKELEKSLECVNGGTYGCVQGPRLETAAEIQKLKNDGCDLVGMTMMPEAVLAREREISYLSVCVVSNWGAGISYSLAGQSVASVCIKEIKAVLAERLTKVQCALVDTLC